MAGDREGSADQPTAIHTPTLLIENFDPQENRGRQLLQLLFVTDSSMTALRITSGGRKPCVRMKSWNRA